MKKRLFIQSIFPAPYRVDVFSGLSKEYDIFVAFERSNDKNRDFDWFVKNYDFSGIILDNKDNIERYDLELKNLRTYDAVLAYDYSSVSSMKLMIRCMKLHIPYFVNCDGAFISRHVVKDLIKRFFITKARACLASGEHAEKYFLTYGAKKENIFKHSFTNLYKKDILNEPISSAEKNRIRENLGLPVNKKIVVSVGQFTHRKGYDILLKAWQLVNDDAHLIIIGGGESEKEYRKFIEINNIDNITIEGFKSKDVVFDYYKAADLFVLPTREDIWGLVINEAMACGLPVITTNRCVAGLELIEDFKNGFIVQVEDSAKLAERMRIIMESDEVCVSMGRESLNRVCHYNIENVVKSHIDTLNLILSVK